MTRSAGSVKTATGARRRSLLLDSAPGEPLTSTSQQPRRSSRTNSDASAASFAIEPVGQVGGGGFKRKRRGETDLDPPLVPSLTTCSRAVPSSTAPVTRGKAGRAAATASMLQVSKITALLQDADASPEPVLAADGPVRRGRGRPRKHPLPAAPASVSTAAIIASPSSSDEESDSDDDMPDADPHNTIHHVPESLGSDVGTNVAITDHHLELSDEGEEDVTATLHAGSGKAGRRKDSSASGEKLSGSGSKAGSRAAVDDVVTLLPPRKVPRLATVQEEEVAAASASLSLVTSPAAQCVPALCKSTSVIAGSAAPVVSAPATASSRPATAVTVTAPLSPLRRACAPAATGSPSTFAAATTAAAGAASPFTAAAMAAGRSTGQGVAAASVSAAVPAAPAAASAAPRFDPFRQDHVQQLKAVLSSSSSTAQLNGYGRAPVGRQAQFDQLLQLLTVDDMIGGSFTTDVSTGTCGLLPSSSFPSPSYRKLASGVENSSHVVNSSNAPRPQASSPAAFGRAGSLTNSASLSAVSKDGTVSNLSRLHSSGSSSQGSQAIYVSGLPGTGKSLTISALVRSLRFGADAPATVWLSCNAFKEASEVFAVLLRECTRELTGVSIEAPAGGSSAAYSALVQLLRSPPGPSTSLSGPKAKKSKGIKQGDKAQPPMQRRVVIVLDEVDRLISKDAADLYQLFMLPALAGASISLVAIANSLDLTDRLLPRLRCQGIAPHLVCFPAYNRSQMDSILTERLASLPWPAFEPAALEACARSVSQSVGDLRHALKACSLALDVLLDHNRACQAAISTATAAVLGQCTAPAPNCSSGQVPGAHSLVSVMDMRAALMRSAGGRGGALNGQSSTIATITALPTQQQLALLALATAVAGAAAAAASSAGASGPGAGGGSTAAAAVAPRQLSLASATTFASSGAFHALPTQVLTFGRDQQNSPLGSKSSAATAGGGGKGAGRVAGVLLPPQQVSGMGVTNTPPPSGRKGAGGGARCMSSPVYRSSPSHAGGSATKSSASKLAGILAGDAGFRVPVSLVYEHYASFCAKLGTSKVEVSEFAGDLCERMAGDGLLKRVGSGGRGGGGGAGFGSGQLSLSVPVRDVQAAIGRNVLFRNLMGVPL